MTRFGRQSLYPTFNPNLFNCVLEPANVHKAWKQVRSNKGAPGVDGMTLEAFPDFAKRHWSSVRQSLLEGTYQPQPVRRKAIPKPQGGERILGIPTVIDRVIQQAIAQVLQPIFDPSFSNSSFGFRPERSAHDAVRQLRQHIRDGGQVAVDVDLKQFFDKVNHDALMVRVARMIRGKRLLKLIGAYLRAGVLVEGQIQPTRLGVPQGGPLSPLLANIMLDDLDKELERRGHHFVRYADDFVILVKSQSAGERVMNSICRFLERRLKLQVNKDKSRVVKATDCEYLGFTFPRNRIVWTDKSLNRFKRKVLELTRRSWGISMVKRMHLLAHYLRGWMGYFALSEYYRPLPGLDEWIRRRIRCCFLKQWRYPRTIVRKLVNLGVSLKQAVMLAGSSKGPYRLAKTYAVQLGLNNGVLASLGLLSMKELWIRFHHSR
ncbi:group II intron reverse transcriptase/maturase [Endozoicomonas arenosclerae]|uniref:group II intron reverse transcriptase/maturase n=1 Tax=Endozoicomonas arenosclerae TaxID=1633495 RepID=UPI0024805A76|nr:group II intron reverse transcriptase/maturase [Endozoicomonas arenosclerae]